MSKRVLIIDDAHELVELISTCLKKEGMEVISARDGMEGLEMAKKESPDLIILDVMMPKMDGYNVCRLLKFDEAYQDIPIIMLTARDQAVDRRAGEEVRADAYVTKPFDSNEIVEKVKDLMKS